MLPFANGIVTEHARFFVPRAKGDGDNKLAACVSHKMSNVSNNLSGNVPDLVHVGIQQLLDQVDAGDVILNASSEQHSETALKCLTEVLRQHRGRVPYTGRKNVLWHHLHNFAGTFMCQEAKLQGERCSRGNCLWEGDGCSASSSQRVHCNVRGTPDAKYTFSMIERSVDEGDFCDGILTGIMLRDPLAAMTSTLQLNLFIKTEIFYTLRRSQRFPLPMSQVGCLPVWDSYHHFDNYATRSLSGDYDAEPRAITERHLELAKRQLDRFDVVLVLEELRKHLGQLSHVAQWNLSRIDSGSKKNSHHSHDLDFTWTSEEQAFLREVNEYDYRLFEYGKQLAQHKSNLAVSIRPPG